MPFSMPAYCCCAGAARGGTYIASAACRDQRGFTLLPTAQERHVHRLRIPRRPAWDRGTSPEELDARERAAFLAWRRDLAQCAPGLVLSSDTRGTPAAA